MTVITKSSHYRAKQTLQKKEMNIFYEQRKKEGRRIRRRKNNQVYKIMEIAQEV